jgi:predicted acyl esterase
MFTKIDAPKRVVIGPWSHFGGSGGYSGPPPDAAIPGPGIDYLRECQRWFDKWLKGIETGVLDEPPIVLFVRKYTKPAPFQPALNGHYRYESEWPLARTKKTAYYLHPDGLLSVEPYTSSEVEGDVHEYNPTLGVTREPLAGQSEFRTPLDQRPDEIYSLVYTTPPLEEDLEVTGIPTATLYVSSTAEVTLFLVKLCDVASDGTSAWVTHEKINATHMLSHEHPAPLEPGKIYELKLDLKAASYVFEKGHRIRVVVSSSDIPDSWPTPDLCTNTVYRGKAYPSRITLPISSKQEPAHPDPNIQSSTLKAYSEAEWKGFVGKPTYLVTRDILNETYTISTKKEVQKGIDDQTTLRNKGHWSMTIPRRNPSNTVLKAYAEYAMLVPAGEIKVSTQMLTIGSPTTYHHIVEVEGKINDNHHFNKTWDISVPRKLS